MAKGVKAFTLRYVSVAVSLSLAMFFVPGFSSVASIPFLKDCGDK